MDGVSEAERAKALLTELHDIDPSRVFTESAAGATVQNAKFLAQMLKKAGATRATLVTSEYHAARAKSFMRRGLRENGLGKKVTLEARSARWRPNGRGQVKLKAREVASRGAGHVLWDCFDR